MRRGLSIPVALAGKSDEVTRRLRPRIKAFLKGEPWSPLDVDESVDAQSVGGLLVLSGPAPLLTGDPHIQAYLPLSLLTKAVAKEQVSPAREDEAVGASLESAWGLLGVLSPPNLMLALPPGRHRPIFDAAVRFWDELDGVGARYTVGLPQGARLWNLPTNLRYVLARLGVPEARLTEPLPPGGLRALVSDQR